MKTDIQEPNHEGIGTLSSAHSTNERARVFFLLVSEPSGRHEIPSRAHFVWIGESFPFVNLLAVRSAAARGVNRSLEPGISPHIATKHRHTPPGGFNGVQPLNFDTSRITDMSHMFNDAKRFDQPLIGLSAPGSCVCRH